MLDGELAPLARVDDLDLDLLAGGQPALRDAQPAARDLGDLGLVQRCDRSGQPDGDRRTARGEQRRPPPQWQLALPASVNVWPATGAKFQL
ncbi:MAG: hypothetical protein JWN77_2672 [Frankiales bacterium]|jgi:hypothetical protein|nr:hypothetical protein [Frankiales bacterium]